MNYNHINDFLRIKVVITAYLLMDRNMVKIPETQRMLSKISSSYLRIGFKRNLLPLFT